MGSGGGRRPAAVLVALSLVAIVILAVAWPRTRTPAAPPPPPGGLPYASVTYSPADAVRAFARVGVKLTPRGTGAGITTVGDPADVLEVDIFGDPEQVKAAGFHDYLLANGRYVRFPSTCRPALPDAERWHGNVRVVVQCAGASPALLAKVGRALPLLGS